MYRHQIDHLKGLKCSSTPEQLKFRNGREFTHLRSLRNPDRTWMRIHFRETHNDFYTSLGAIGEAILNVGRQCAVEGI